jgi:hypothetical protein
MKNTYIKKKGSFYKGGVQDQYFKNLKFYIAKYEIKADIEHSRRKKVNVLYIML